MNKDQPYSTCKGIVPIAPIHIYIDAEYFRPKFETILRNYFYLLGISEFSEEKNKTISDRLIECLKNPEGK